MPKKFELMKKLVCSIIILLEAIFVFSYRNLNLDIEGICEECSADTELMNGFGTIMLATQVIIAVILYLRFNADNNLITFIVHILLGGLGAVLSFYQIFCFTEVSGRHGELSAKGEFEIKMMDIQFTFVQIVSIIMILIYIILIFMSLYNLVLIKNGAVQKYMYNVILENPEEEKAEITSVSKNIKVFMKVNLYLIVMLAIVLFISCRLNIAIFIIEYMYLTPMVLTTCWVNKYMKKNKVKKTIVMYIVLLFMSYRIINTCMGDLKVYANVYIIGLFMTCIAYIVKKLK